MNTQVVPLYRLRGIRFDSRTAHDPRSLLLLLLTQQLLLRVLLLLLLLILLVLLLLEDRESVAKYNGNSYLTV